MQILRGNERMSVTQFYANKGILFRAKLEKKKVSK